MKYFINYASGGFFNSQNQGLQSASEFGFESIGYTDTDIDDDFKSKYSNILNSKRGCGYWIWKPYIILDMFNKMSDDDYLIYMDSGAKLVKDPSEFMEMIDEKGILAFSMLHKQYKWYVIPGCYQFVYNISLYFSFVNHVPMFYTEEVDL